MIHQIIKTIKKSNFKSRGIDTITKFVGYFESQYQKYYWEYVTSDNSCGSLINSIFEDMNHVVDEKGTKYDK